jgi:hypothetical protein
LEYYSQKLDCADEETQVRVRMQLFVNMPISGYLVLKKAGDFLTG